MSPYRKAVKFHLEAQVTNPPSLTIMSILSTGHLSKGEAILFHQSTTSLCSECCLSAQIQRKAAAPLGRQQGQQAHTGPGHTGSSARTVSSGEKG